jgi:alpha-1,2-mannosyltransferase
LPQPYLRDVEKPTAELRSNFNDLNADEADRYDIGDLTRDCDFLVDFEGFSETALEPRYSRDAGTWAKEASYPFLDAQHSHKLLRAFYVPFVSSRYCHFGEYVLLRNIAKLKKHSKSEKQQRKHRSS